MGDGFINGPTAHMAGTLDTGKRNKKLFQTRQRVISGHCDISSHFYAAEFSGMEVLDLVRGCPA